MNWRWSSETEVCPEEEVLAYWVGRELSFFSSLRTGWPDGTPQPRSWELQNPGTPAPAFLLEVTLPSFLNFPGLSSGKIFFSVSLHVCLIEKRKDLRHFQNFSVVFSSNLSYDNTGPSVSLLIWFLAIGTLTRHCPHPPPPCSKTVVPVFELEYESSGELVKERSLGSTPRFWLGRAGWGPRVCISNRVFLGGAATALIHCGAARALAWRTVSCGFPPDQKQGEQIVVL